MNAGHVCRKTLICIWVSFFFIIACMGYAKNVWAAESGWITEGDALYYIDPETGNKAQGITLIGGKYYYFSGTGKNLRGWRTIDGDRYYFLQSDGRMVINGFITWRENRYYFGSDGRMVTNDFVTWKENSYYLGPDGIMATGICEANGKEYYFSGNGEMLRGWRTIGGERYYFLQSSGVMVKNAYVVWRDNRYYFGPDGRMVRGIYTIKGKSYYFAEKSGEMLRGWRTIGEDRYYFLQSDGTMVTQNFVTWRDNRYYFGPDGRMVRGFYEIKGKTCYFAPKTGEMLKGWRNIDGDRYYFLQGDGTMVTGHFVVWRENRYYLGVDGKLVTNQEDYLISGTKYDIDSTGIAVPATKCQVTLCGNDGVLLRIHTLDKGSEFVIPSLVNPDGSTFIGWSLSPGVRFTLSSPRHVDYEIGETITVSKSLRLYAAIFSDYDDIDLDQNEITMPADEFGGVIFVGDSRQDYTDFATEEYQDISGKVYFVAKGGIHFAWFVDEGYPILLSRIEEIRNTTDKPIAVVFNLGINDLREPGLDFSAYIPFMESIAPTLKEQNCILFYESVLPGNAEQLKISRESGVALPNMAAVRYFNSQIRSALASDYIFIDMYSWVMSYGYCSEDGLHFSYPTNRRILDECMRRINACVQ